MELNKIKKLLSILVVLSIFQIVSILSASLYVGIVLSGLRVDIKAISTTITTHDKAISSINGDTARIEEQLRFIIGHMVKHGADTKIPTDADTTK